MRILLLLLCISLNFHVAVAEPCVVLETAKSGMKKIQVGDTTFFALTRDQMVACSQLKKSSQLTDEVDQTLETLVHENKQQKQLIADLQQHVQLLREQIAQDSQLLEKQEKAIARSEELNVKYQKTLNKSIQLTQDFEKTGTSLANLNKKYAQHVQSWADHAEECRELATNGNSGLVFDLGVGFTSAIGTGSSKAVGLVGVGFQNMKVWGLMQKNNNGVLLGVSKAF